VVLRSDAILSYEATVTSKGQLTLPKELRKRFHLEEGEKVLLIPVEEGIMLKHGLNPLRKVRGILRQELDVDKASAFIKEIRKEWRLD
jgi:AbrB family looped-hinge helix DNA binding protein